MKRIISFALLLSLVLTLCACGGAGNAVDSKYDTLIQLMDQGKYDEAKAEIDRISGSNSNSGNSNNNGSSNNNGNSGDSNNSNPQKVTVEITPENWDQYFELRMYPKIELNGFGELDRCIPYYSIVSKDGLVPVHEESNVTMEFTYTGEYHSATVDIANKTLVLGELVETGRTSDPRVETLNTVGQYIGEYTATRYGEYITCDWLYEVNIHRTYVVTSVAVSRATGSFTYTLAE